MQIVQKALLRALPWVPPPLIRKVAGRYIAGASIEELLQVVASIQGEGLLTTIDLLGEDVDTEGGAAAAVAEYLSLMGQLSARRLFSEVSVKLTLLGLRLGEDVARRSLEAIVECGRKLGISVCIDMEDSSTTTQTLEVFRSIRERYDNVGVALQAYLHRSERDLEALLPLKPVVRVCKGIYAEPPEHALQDRSAIRQNFLKLVDRLLAAGGFPAIATHDAWLVDRILSRLGDRGRPRAPHEFQMLLGVGASLHRRILAAGSPLRLYCPYGPEWYAYSLRRLRENPKLLLQVLKGLVSPSSLGRGGSKRYRVSNWHVSK